MREKKIFVLLCILATITFSSILTACNKVNVEDCMPSVLEISILDGDGDIVTQGTGFCVVGKNTLISVAHLFEQYDAEIDSIIACTINEEKIKLTLIRIDKDKDLALLHAEENEFVPIEISKNDPKNLDEIYIIGNSRGYGLGYNKGIVSMSQKSLSIKENVKTVMQTNITINPGDSGAPVLNTKNQLIGIMTFKLTDGNGQSVDGISFSVLRSDIINFLNQAS